MKNRTEALDRSLLFRPDIEGLRGFAVILVMLLHFNAPYITGGFIGVDIFFVLSGFLITQMIVLGVHDQRFSFKVFYQRRIKRLAPSLIFVVLLTIIGFSFFLLPGDFTSLLKSARDVFLFKSNIHFAKEIKDYFGSEAEAMPLLHTWSLAIEWQFYFLFPIIMYTILRFFKKPILILVTLLVCFSIYSIYASYYVEPAYFLTSARAFEFLVGACAVFIKADSKNKYSSFITASALIALFAMAILFDANSIYPGFNALWVSIATFAILTFGLNNKFLSTSPMTIMGKLSYSAYLWHWPLVVAMYHFGYKIDGYLLIPMILTSFILSTVTYHLIENPIRKSNLSFKHSIIWLVIIPILIIMSVFYTVRKYDGLPQRLGEKQARAFSVIMDSYDPMRKKCQTHTGNNIEECSFGETTSPIGKALFIGDSHASHFKVFVDTLSKDAKLKTYIQTDSACLMLKGGYSPEHENKNKSCKEKKAEMYELINDEEFDYVIISQRWLGYSTNMKRYKDALTKSISYINERGAVPVLLLPIAEGNGNNINLCFYQNINNQSSCDIEKSDSDKKLIQIYKMMDEISLSFPETVFVDPQTVQCSKTSCMTHYDDIPLYSDTHHIFDYSAKLFAERYLNKLGNPLINN